MTSLEHENYKRIISEKTGLASEHIEILANTLDWVLAIFTGTTYILYDLFGSTYVTIDKSDDLEQVKELIEHI